MVDWITKVNPASVLDIGVGYGKWGFLAREYTDINAHRYTPETWQVCIEGIEAFPDYATPMYSYIYNTIHYGDALTLLPTLGSYDLVIIGDVIEHFSKEDGQRLLSLLRERTKYILLSSPTVFFEQELFDNPFEMHKSLWTVKDFAEYDFDYDEYDQWVFVALLRGDLKDENALRLSGKASRRVYSSGWLKKHPKFAHLAKALYQHLP